MSTNVTIVSLDLSKLFRDIMARKSFTNSLGTIESISDFNHFGEKEK